MNKGEFHISNCLGAMVRKWETTNPEAIRALKRFDEENGHILTNPEKARNSGATRPRRRTYVCSNGEKLDLYKIKRECLDVKPTPISKTKSFIKKGKEKDGFNTERRV